ncbi:LysR family transcriptional regulator [Streptomyces cucumeris]|uniref:LysR family transcriptional regulator n=1 Tax=Streptomyces cucumeris TaxID=2962890 RepID=UPI003EBE7EBD
MLKPLHLITLKAVVRSGSFAIAARDLGYTASAISQQISALEKETGLVLFEREAHGIRATTAAHRLVDLSARVLAALDDLDHQVRELATGTVGRLRLGTFPTAGVRLVPAALSAAVAALPRAEIQLAEGEPEELIALLVQGDLDIAVVYEYGLSPRHWPDGLTRHPLLREDLVLLRARGNGLGAELPQLARARWITSREDTGGAVSLTRLCAAAGFDADVVFRSNNYDVVRELVSSGLGVAVVPALGHKDSTPIEATRLTRRSAHRTVLALHRAENSNPLLGTVLEALRRAVPRDEPYLRPVGAAEDGGGDGPATSPPARPRHRPH